MNNDEIREMLERKTNQSLEISSTARANNKSKGNYSAWRKTWDDAITRLYPECLVTYPDRVQNNLKQAIAKRGLPYSDMCNFLDWIVVNWQILRKQVFSLNPRVPYGPEVPDLQFVIPNLAKVHAYYTARKPGMAGILPLNERAAGTVQPVALPVPVAPKLIAKPLPRPRAAALNRIPVKPFTIDKAANEAARQRLGLPAWDDK